MPNNDSKKYEGKKKILHTHSGQSIKLYMVNINTHEKKKHSFISNKQMNQIKNKINTTCFKQLQPINDK